MLKYFPALKLSNMSIFQQILSTDSHIRLQNFLFQVPSATQFCVI